MVEYDDEADKAGYEHDDGAKKPRYDKTREKQYILDEDTNAEVAEFGATRGKMQGMFSFENLIKRGEKGKVGATLVDLEKARADAKDLAEYKAEVKSEKRAEKAKAGQKHASENLAGKKREYVPSAGYGGFVEDADAEGEWEEGEGEFDYAEDFGEDEGEEYVLGEDEYFGEDAWEEDEDFAPANKKATKNNTAKDSKPARYGDQESYRSTFKKTAAKMPKYSRKE